ncbi:f-box domain-containing protein [Gigaspora margarita]|uniref:F-box domain-containing protein n=1 Tax=Gigaspora margarita TaxID=4874 RepID=A0A8H3XI57_GIGMA|nr:f-box domain-containing protein [Gigaspora margarita]
MNAPNEIFLEIFNNLRASHRSLFSCLLVNRRWCINIVPILWSEPRYYDRRLIRTCLLSLNAEEQALFIPFKIMLPNEPKPLFEYTSYITSINYYLNDGIKNWLKYEGCKVPEDAVKYSLIAMFLRTSKKLKYLTTFNYDDIAELLIDVLYKNTAIITLNLNGNQLDKAKALAEALSWF